MGNGMGCASAAEGITQWVKQRFTKKVTRGVTNRVKLVMPMLRHMVRNVQRHLADYTRIISALMLIFLLPACSAIKLGYNSAPELAYFWLDSQIDFTDAQSQRVRSELAQFQTWHRAQELPKYADILKRLQPLAAGDVTNAQACTLFDEARARIDASLRQAEPAVAALLQTVTAAQVEHLEAKFAKGNAEFREKWLDASAAEVRQLRFKQSVQRSEDVYGSLEPAQQASLRESMNNSVFEARMAYQEKLRRQQDVLTLMRAMISDKPGPARTQELLRALLERLATSPDPAYRAYFQKSAQEACGNFARLHNVTTTQQRERAARRMAAYERDLRELAAERR